jgi:hypothetical protein
MAATHTRRRKSENRLESVTCDLTNFIEPLVNAELPIKDVILKILAKSGPHGPAEIRQKLSECGKITNSVYYVRKSLMELRLLGLVVRVNGGYAIYNWNEIGK